MVLQAIDEMVKEYTGDDLSRRLSWLDTLLERADILPDIEKHKVEEHLHMFDELLEENKHLREIAERIAAKKVARLVAEVTDQITARITDQVTARVTDQVTARVTTQVANQTAAREMQEALMEVIQARFSQLAGFAWGKVPQINESRMLHTLITQVAIAPDEETVRNILNNPLL